MRGVNRAGLAMCAAAAAAAAQAGETITYGYDELGRLTKVSRSGTAAPATESQYRYDPADNRTEVIVGTPGPTVVGGGFESPEQGTGYAYRPTSGPALFAGNSGIAGNGSLWGFDPAPEGDQVAFLQGGAEPAIVTLNATGLTPGTAYVVHFRISARPNHWGMPVTVAFNGAALGTFNPPSTSFTAATSASFTATAATGTLTFTGTGTAYNNSGLDRVTIAPAGSP